MTDAVVMYLVTWGAGTSVLGQTCMAEMVWAKLSIPVLLLTGVIGVVVLLVRRKFAGAAILGAVMAFVLLSLMVSFRMAFLQPDRSPSVSQPAVTLAGSSESTPAVEAAFVPPQPRAGVPTIIAPDDYTPWRSAQGIVSSPKLGPGEEWALKMGGAQYVRESVGSIDCIYWKPGAANELIGYASLALSPIDASRQSMEAAERKVGMLGLRAALSKLPAGPGVLSGSNWDAQSMRDVEALATRLAREMHSYYVKGTLAQEITRSYGNLYCHAVSVGTEPAVIESLGERIAEKLRGGHLLDQTRLRGVAFAVAGLLVLLMGLFAAFCLVRAGTTGALAWPLRIAALMVLALLGAAVYLLGTRGV